MPNSQYTADGANLFRETTLQPIAGLTALDGTGKTVPFLVNADGTLPSGTGSATAANQVTQITAEQAIQSGVGATTDAAATAGSTGSLSAKFRLVTTQLANLLSGITKVGSTTVVGITEVDAYVTGAASSHTVSAGALAIAVNFSSDFTGTVQGATYTSANQGVAVSRVAQPGNLLPAMVITRSAGTFDYYVVTPA